MSQENNVGLRARLEATRKRFDAARCQIAEIQARGMPLEAYRTALREMRAAEEAYTRALKAFSHAVLNGEL